MANSLIVNPIVRLAGYLRRLDQKRRFLGLFGCGSLATFALAPYGIVPVMLIAMPCFVWLMDGACVDKALAGRLRQGFWAGWWFGFGYFIFGLWWLGAALLGDDGKFIWALPFAVLGLPAILAIFYGLAGVLAAIFWRKGPIRLVGLAIAMVIVEWLRGHVATGFPWNAIAYTAMPTPIFMQSIRLVGLYGMGGLAVYVFSAPALITEKRGRVLGLGAALVIAVIDIGYGYYQLQDHALPAGHVVNFRLVQPAIDDEMWSSKEREGAIFEALIELSFRPPGVGVEEPDVIVWPESSLPFLLEGLADARTMIGELLKPGQVLILGAAKFAGRNSDGWPKFYNAVYVLNDQGKTISIAGKTHLVPFGEYLPFETFFRSIGLDTLTTLPGTYIPAKNRQTLRLPDGINLYPLICYEASFPRLVGEQAHDAAALLNITYDAWFGATPGPYQHFAQSRLRAVEAQKQLIRVGENGITAVVDTKGRVLRRIPFNQSGVLDIPITLE